jgi:PAS domain S-box-containing protein
MNLNPDQFAESCLDAPVTPDQKDEINKVLSKFFDIMFPSAVVFGAVALIVSTYRSYNNGWFLSAVLHITMYLFAVTVLIFRRRLPVQHLFYSTLGVIYVAVIDSLLTMGLASDALMSLMVLCVFAGVFLGAKEGLITLVLGVLVVSAIGAGICTGVIHTRPMINTYLYEPSTWILHISFIPMYLVPLILSINYMRKRMLDSILLLQKTNKQLHEEISRRIVVENTLVGDIAKRNAVEAALHQSELKYRSVVENSLAAFYIVQDNLFKYVNPAFCAITGYSYDEVVDHWSPRDITHPDDLHKLDDGHKNCMDSSDGCAEYERRIIKKGGTPIIVKVMKRILVYNGKIALFVTMLDVTNEKSLEAKLLQAQKMEALGTLTGGIAHDFNNILTALMGYGTILRMKLEDASPLKHYAENILSASEKAANLIKSLLSFSRLKPITLKPVNLNRIIHDTEKLLKRVITEDIILATELADEGINILADQTQIEQILFNLVSNARDAMPDGGRLMISTQTVVLDEEFIRINGFGKIGRYALIRVSDNGCGMDEQVKQKIFDPFFTTKDIGKGTGLGLSTVYGIIKQNNGYAVVDSEPGRGTDFNIYLPLIKEDSVESKKISPELREGKETILVAEDNNDARFFIRDILEYYGYSVVDAVDGDDALYKFVESPGISLVIIDSIMPKKNGKEVYESIRKINSEIKFLFISGHAKEVVLSKGIMNSHVEFISKPFSPEELLKKVGELLDG